MLVISSFCNCERGSILLLLYFTIMLLLFFLHLKYVYIFLKIWSIQYSTNLNSLGEVLQVFDNGGGYQIHDKSKCVKCL